MRTSLLILVLISAACADGPKDNHPDNVRLIPPKGAAISDKDRAELKAGLAKLIAAADGLQNSEHYPDVAVFMKAVQWALYYDEIYVDKGRDDVKTLHNLIKIGVERAEQLKAGKTPWLTQTGLVVRGYRSRIDDSIQPYGLVIPKDHDFTKPSRLDLWWHGRGETLTEANFLEQRMKNAGEFSPANAIVLHPYGRFCNANKFAGETDTFEAIEHVKKHYKIDDKKIVARGFSMGGAACWQFATHYPTFWAAANPGAGFAETPEFLNNFQNETVKPTWYEERLWKLTNATDYALNLSNLPVIAYSGEIDKQKQAADVMEREAKKVGVTFEHIIGPKTAHKYEAEAKKTVSSKLDTFLAKEQEPFRKSLRFTTHTLRYNRCDWIVIENLEKHWQEATVTAEYADGVYTITTKNVAGMTVIIPAGTNGETLIIDGKKALEAKNPPLKTAKHHYMGKHEKIGWYLHSEENDKGKRPGLQGPIDDAFMDRFIIVRPTGKPMSEATGKWVDAEMNRAIREWRRVFRGEAIVKNDTEITDEDMKTANLILWGDPKSNAHLGKIAARLPLAWPSATGGLAGPIMLEENQVPLMIYPNPLNPKKYVVLNSGFTFREYDALNNARQTAKLPDYAIVDITTPPNSRSPGKIVRAGFFDEQWKLQKDDGR